MKVPETFRLKKDLEEKITQLLEKPIIKKPKEQGRLYEEVKKEFPNIVDYIFELYPNLSIVKVTSQGTVIWQFHRRLAVNAPTTVGSIETYKENRSVDVSEYGYKAHFLINGQWHDLKYRKGLHCYDTGGKIVSKEDPKRYDEAKEVPFP